ncbi:hypothetical protein [Dictyobacter formicarum]|uniref:Uncharacterized protein n=1 Tax=Dictyobacter formicarum TaxID=2778368 RepID=A0ABQ3VPJ9_9CHLR|nr:hypothetical protein [Dictyobacter formicarum]GHO87594.1 hypothetical protein KSZ_56000 [Dictyobacter formicarum]
MKAIHLYSQSRPDQFVFEDAPKPQPGVGRGIQTALKHFYGEAEDALKQRLAQTTVADLLEETLQYC